MPIYAYKCESCGLAKDVLQKISDAPLTVCPSCGAPTFRKQLTAAGFQLKGSGWYATDFKGGSGGGSGTTAGAPGDAKSATDGAGAETKGSETKGTETKGIESKSAESKSTESKPSESKSAAGGAGKGQAAAAPGAGRPTAR